MGRRADLTVAPAPHFAVSQGLHLGRRLERLTANEFTREFFRLYKVHCWRFGANEPLRFASKSDSLNSHGGSRASYSSLRRKKRDRQAGDSADTPSEESARLSQAVSVFLNTVLCGVPTVPLHPTLQELELLGLG